MEHPRFQRGDVDEQGTQDQRTIAGVMTDSKPNELEKSIQRVLLRRRFLALAGAAVLFLLLVGMGRLLWYARVDKPFAAPNYSELDPASTTYWIDRTLADIRLDGDSNVPKRRETERRTSRILDTMTEARKIESHYGRIMAVKDIALSLTDQDVDVNIDDTIRTLGDSSLAQSVAGRIFVSQSLMYIRLKNEVAARVAYQDYRRLLIDGDLILNSELNDLSFCGACTALFCLGDVSALNELQQKQTEFSLRVLPPQQMKAYRIIAGEQARLGQSMSALETMKKIDSLVEMARGYQLVIGFAARPVKIEPVEPRIAIPRTEGPWESLSQPTSVRYCIDEMLKRTMRFEEIDLQIAFLMKMAGSRLMCDPEVYRLFRESILGETQMDELVKRPVLKLLDNPVSGAIRDALGMEPLPPQQRKNIDPALDNWAFPMDLAAVDLAEFDPALGQLIRDQQVLRTQRMVGYSFLSCSRFQDATRVLRSIFDLARSLPSPGDRNLQLLAIGEQQVGSGDIEGAWRSLRTIGTLPEPTENEGNSESEAPDPVEGDVARRAFFAARAADLVKLQVVARDFDGALANIPEIASESQRNEEYRFLVLELFRTGRLERAEAVLGTMEAGRTRDELAAALTLARTGKSQAFRALEIVPPEEAANVHELNRACDRLIRLGLLHQARLACEHFKDSPARNRFLIKIVRELTFLYKVYVVDNEEHRAIRAWILEEIFQAARKIDEPYARFQAMATSLFEIVYLGKRPGSLEAFGDYCVETRREADGVKIRDAASAELLARLILVELILHVGDKSRMDAWPAVDPRADEAFVDLVSERAGAVVSILNDSEMTAARGRALAYLTEIMGQVGRLRSARILLLELEQTIKDLPNRRERIDLLLQSVPLVAKLRDREAVRLVFDSAAQQAAALTAPGAGSDDAGMGLQFRDSELDRIIRVQFQYDFLFDGIEYAMRIQDAVVASRLLRDAVYLCVARDDMELAEVTARRIPLDNVKNPVLNNLMFTKRQKRAAESP